MKPDAQRIAIAEACGLVPCEHWQYFMPGQMMKGECGHKKCYPLGCPAHYESSLQAMHEAEKWVYAVHPSDVCGSQNERASSYAKALREICLRDYNEHKHWSLSDAHATAAQRAEAFLRTIGKWEEQP